MDFKNGYRQTKNPQFANGGDRLNYNQLNENELAMLQNYKPSMIYGRAKPEAPDNFVPATVAYDKKVIYYIKLIHIFFYQLTNIVIASQKVLRFYGYFKQTVYESPNEFYRVRPVTIFYYLEDDSMQVFEALVENSGIPQVKFS